MDVLYIFNHCTCSLTNIVVALIWHWIEVRLTLMMKHILLGLWTTSLGFLSIFYSVCVCVWPCKVPMRVVLHTHYPPCLQSCFGCCWGCQVNNTNIYFLRAWYIVAIIRHTVHHVHLVVVLMHFCNQNFSFLHNITVFLLVSSHFLSGFGITCTWCNICASHVVSNTQLGVSEIAKLWTAVIWFVTYLPLFLDDYLPYIHELISLVLS